MIAIADEDEKLQLNELESDGNAFTVHEDRLRVWPPWPWPPWDPEDPDDPDHPGRKPQKPINRTKEAHQLAIDIIEFEKKIANVSLDPYVAN